MKKEIHFTENDVLRILTLIEVFGIISLLEMFACQYKKEHDLLDILGLSGLGQRELNEAENDK